MFKHAMGDQLKLFSGTQKQKQCRICKQVKDLSRYYHRKDTDSYRGECRECTKALSERYREENPEKVRETNRKYHWRNREARNQESREYRRQNRERLRKYDRQRYQDRRTEHLEYLKQWREENPEIIEKHNRKWHRNNPILRKVLDQRKRAWRQDADGTFTHSDVVRMWNDQLGKCYWCGDSLGSGAKDTEEYHIDHITPVSRGGTNWPRNLCISCPGCNISKGDKWPIEFKQYLSQ